MVGREEAVCLFVQTESIVILAELPEFLPIGVLRRAEPTQDIHDERFALDRSEFSKVVGQIGLYLRNLPA